MTGTLTAEKNSSDLSAYSDAEIARFKEAAEAERDAALHLWLMTVAARREAMHSDDSCTEAAALRIGSVHELYTNLLAVGEEVGRFADAIRLNLRSELENLAQMIVQYLAGRRRVGRGEVPAASGLLKALAGAEMALRQYWNELVTRCERYSSELLGRSGSRTGSLLMQNSGCATELTALP